MSRHEVVNAHARAIDTRLRFNCDQYGALRFVNAPLYMTHRFIA